MAPSRGINKLVRLLRRPNIHPQCRSTRTFSTTPALLSGHSRWSKIKHDKGRADAANSRKGAYFAQELATASRLFGPDPASNSRLADLITKAKRESVTKASIDAAIARGQGRSVSGASLESVTVEGILPNNVAVIVEYETDNRARTMMNARLAMKTAGGVATPSAYLFKKQSRIIFEKKDGVGVDEVLEPALDAGALDLDEDEEGRLVVSSEPESTTRVAETLASSLNLQVATSDILWEPNEDTKVGVPSEPAAQDLINFVDHVHKIEPDSVRAIAMNVQQGTLPDEPWHDLRSRIDF